MVRRRGTGAVIGAPALPARCGMGLPGTVTLTLTAPPGGRLGVSSFQVAPGRQGTVSVPLWAAGKSRLRSHGRLPLEVKVRPRWHTPGGLGGSNWRYVALRLPQHLSARRHRLSD